MHTINVASNEQISKPYFYEEGRKQKDLTVTFGPNAFGDIESESAVIELKIGADLHASIMKKGLYKSRQTGQIQAHLQKQVALMSKSGKTTHVVCCDYKENISRSDWKILVSWSYQYGFYAHHCDSLDAAVNKCIKLATKGMKRLSGLITSDIKVSSDIAGAISLMVKGCSLDFADYLCQTHRIFTMHDATIKLSEGNIKTDALVYFKRNMSSLAKKIMEKVG